MHLLLIGGTAFLGRHIAEAALAAGHRVTLFNRGRSAPGRVSQAEQLIGDRDTPEGLAALQGRAFDAVIDCCGYRPEQLASMAAALGQPAWPYLFVSSISVVRRFPPHTRYDEDAERLTGDDGYGALKARCEDAIAAAWRGPLCIVRPGLIVGPHDPTGRYTYWPERVARGGEVLAPGRPERPVQWIDVRDLAAWCLRLAEARTRGVLHAVGPNLPMAALLDACRRVTNPTATLRWIDDATLLAAGVEPWTGLPLWLPENDAEHGGMLLADDTRARDAGLTTRPVDDTVRATLAWRQGEGRALSPKVQTLSAEREAELLRVAGS